MFKFYERPVKGSPVLMGRLDYEFKEIKMSTYKKFCIRFDQTLKKAGFKKAQILETFED